LIVADADNPRVHVLDLEDESVVVSLPLAGSVSFAESEARDHLLLLSLDTPTVQALWAGVSVVNHDEGFDTPHLHIYKFEPELLTLPAVDLRVREAFARDEVVSLISAQQGTYWFREPELTPPAVPELRDVPDIGAALRRAIPDGAGWLVAAVSSDGAERVMAVDAEGAMLEDYGTCGTGAAAAGWSFTAFACDDDVLRISRLPAGQAAVERIRLGGGSKPASLASYPAHAALLIVDDQGGAWVHDASQEARPLAARKSLCELALEPAQGLDAVALSADGFLELIELASGNVSAALKVSEPFDCDGSLRPRMALSPERAFVSLPTTGGVVDVRLPELRILRSHFTPGTPSDLAVVGVDPRTRNLGLGAPD
jgi:hypothetical protein